MKPTKTNAMAINFGLIYGRRTYRLVRPFELGDNEASAITHQGVKWLVEFKEPTIPCLGSWTETMDGRDFDCDYEHAGHVTCDDCIVNGGRLDPRKPPDDEEWTRFACWKCGCEWNEDGYVEFGTCPDCGWDTRDREGLDSPCVG